MSKNNNFTVLRNYFYRPYYQKDFKKITNTSLIIVWKNNKKKEFKYLIQKRGNKMKHGKNKLAVGGGMLEKSDRTLQYGALREVLEESQIQFKKINNLNEKTILQLEKCLFPLETNETNFTFFMIIVSNKKPEIKGPIDNNNIKPFLKSTREINLEDNKWNNPKLKNKIKNGHAFLTKKEILMHFSKKPKIWKYSKKSLLKLFSILEF